MDYSVREHPRESVNWRRYRDACPHYRVRWFPDSEPEAGEPFYQVFCLMNTPAQTWEEQEKCLSSRTRCWRLAEAQRKAPHGIDIPLSSIKPSLKPSLKPSINPGIKPSMKSGIKRSNPA